MRSLAAFVVLSAALGACASRGGPDAGAVTAQEQFGKLRSLAGTWKTVPGSQMEGTLAYRVTANGSVVEERIFPGTDHEMVTMYHLDGDALVMTHYCAFGNQPTMRALPSKDLKEIRFSFVSLGNGDWKKDPHMHDGSLAFGDDGRLRTHWRSFENGAPGQFEAKLELVRAD